MFEEYGQGEFHSQFLLQQAYDLNGSQGLTSYFKEIVVDIDVWNAKSVTPNLADYRDARSIDLEFGSLGGSELRKP